MFAWAYHNIPQLTLVALRFMKFKNNGAAQVARFIGSYLLHPSGLRESCGGGQLYAVNKS